MKNALATPRSAAIISLLLALPFAIIYMLIVLEIEPPLGPLEPLLRGPVDRPNVLGSAIVFGAWLLALVALILDLAPIIRTLRAGDSLTAHPINLLLAIATFFFIAMFVGTIIVDQYPCWIGVPNCD